MSKRGHSHSALDDTPKGGKRQRTTSSLIDMYADVRHTIGTLPADPNCIMVVPGPVYRLPVNIHIKLYQAVWKAINVYGDRIIISYNETRKIRIFEEYIVPIVSLFEGRLINQPGSSETYVSSGGHIEHEIFIFGGALLVVIESTRDYLTPNDVGQTLCHILAAATRNKKIPGLKNLHIRGILTNLTEFYFYAYDPITKTFSQECPMLSGLERRDFLRKMIPIANKIFSVMFTSYIEALSCTLRAINSIAPHEPKVAFLASLSSTPNWEQALQFAKDAKAHFEMPGNNFEEKKANYTEAVKLLRSSALAIPRKNVPESYNLDEEPLANEALNVVTRVYEQ